MDLSRVFVYNSEIYDGKSTPMKGCQYWADLLASPESARTYKWDDFSKPGEEHTTLALNYSSGTTGVPKGVEITHYNYISNTLQAAQIAEESSGLAAPQGACRGAVLPSSVPRIRSDSVHCRHDESAGTSVHHGEV